MTRRTHQDTATIEFSSALSNTAPVDEILSPETRQAILDHVDSRNNGKVLRHDQFSAAA